VVPVPAIPAAALAILVDGVAVLDVREAPAGEVPGATPITIAATGGDTGAMVRVGVATPDTACRSDRLTATATPRAGIRLVPVSLLLLRLRLLTSC
jgi:hypothetical protein